jgi:hypothetical protein
MSGETWRLLDWFKNNKGKSKTRLAINSNLGAQVDLERLLASIEGLEVDLYTSNEAVGAQAEYIRDGLDYQAWQDNMLKLAQSKKLRGLHVMCTVNALCLDTLPEFLTWIMETKSKFGRDYPNFTLNILRFPSFQSALVLPDELRMQYKEQLERWLTIYQYHTFMHEHERNHVQRLIDYLDVVKTPHREAFEMPKLHNDFKQFYSQYDVRRNKDLITAFPTLKTWYESL